MNKHNKLLCMVFFAMMVAVGVAISPIFGATLSGIFYKLSKGKIWAAVLGEIIGTGIIGSIISYPVMTYLWGKTGLTWMFYVPSFLMGTIIGGSIAFVVLTTMSRNGSLQMIQRKLGVNQIVETNH